MKKLGVMAVVGLGLIGAVGTAMAQPYGGPDYGYRDRDRDRDRDYRDRDYRSRDSDYRDRDYRDRRDDYGRRDDYRGRDRDYGSRDYGDRNRAGAAFNEREYLRCNPDVARAVLAGKMESGYKHFQVHGFREGRKLAC